VQGIYYEAGETISTTLANGDVRSTTRQTVSRVSNRTILEAMRDRALIPTISGYRLVMVAHGHMADGVAWFATKKSGTPVPVPSDLLSLDVSNGPATGQWVVDANALLKSLRQQTINQTSLTLAGGFAGTGLLNQAWTARSVKNSDTTEAVELVASSGSFTGALNAAPESGVGTAQITLLDSKIVDLTPYGMATTDTGSTGGMISSGSLTLSGSNTYTGSVSITAGTLALNGSTLSDGSVLGLTNSDTLSGGTLTLVSGTLSSTILSSTNFTGPLAINTTTGATLSGLVVDSTGTITQLPTFTGSLQPSKLIITTSSGTYTYTKDSNGVWALVTS